MANERLATEELSEEDQKLKDELDMLVERLDVRCLLIFGVMVDAHTTQESDSSLYKPALEAIKDSIKTSTSSMTAVPKPLKFLRPHYERLEKVYESWPEGENKVGSSQCVHVPYPNCCLVITCRHAVCAGHDLFRRPKRHPQIPPPLTIARPGLMGPRIHEASGTGDRRGAPG